MDSDVTPYTIPIRRVQAVVGLALNKGWDIEAMLGTAEISPSLLSEGRARVTTEQTAALVRQVWRATDDELLGFGIEPVPRGTFRLLCMAVLSARNLQAAIDRFTDFGRAVPGIPPVTVAIEGELAVVSFDIGAIEEPVGLLVDTLLAVTHRFLAWAIGRRIVMHSVEVPYAEPAGVDDYDLIFGAPIVFSAKSGGGSTRVR